MSVYSGVFNKSIDVAVSAKNKDTDAKTALVFFNKTSAIHDVAYAVEVTAGISTPFTLKLTVLSSRQPSRTELKNDLLFSNYTVTLNQDNDWKSNAPKKVQRYCYLLCF